MPKRDQNHKAYWNRRILLDKARIINNAETYLKEHQEKLYGEAEKEIQAEVDRLYEKFADQQKITLAEARRLVRGADFRKVNWDGMIRQSMDLRDKIRNGNLPDQVVEMLEKQHKALEARMAAYTKRGEISWLELRRIEIDRKLLDLYDEQQMNIYDFLKSEYEDGYYRQIFNAQQRIGFGKDFIRLNDRAIEKAIFNQYLPQHFSERLYAHCKNFSQDLKENLVTGLIRGESLDRMASRIHKRMGVAASAARRLVRTETAYIYEQATKDAYEQCEVEWYEYLAALDNLTSEICRTLDGKHFRVKDALPGKNYPPMHPNCRSTTVCWFPGEEDKKKKTTRLAKDETGKYYEVPADMTYGQWQKKYGPLADDRGRRRRQQWDEKHDLKRPVGLKDIPHAEEIRQAVVNNPSPAAKLLLKYYDQIRILNMDAHGGGVYLSSKRALRYDAEFDLNDPRGPHTSLFHEVGHMIDDLSGHISYTRGFAAALKKDSDRLFKNLLETETCDSMEDAYAYIDDMAGKNKSYHAIWDLLEATTESKVRGPSGGREEGYWKKPGRLEREAFAHFFSASLVGNDTKLNSIRQTFPQASLIFEEMIKDGL